MRYRPCSTQWRRARARTRPMPSLRTPPRSQHAEITLLHELIADFEPYATVEADDAQVKALHPIPARLAKELSEWHSFRTATLNRLRTGTKVRAPEPD